MYIPLYFRKGVPHNQNDTENPCLTRQYNVATYQQPWHRENTYDDLKCCQGRQIGSFEAEL